MFIIVMSMIVAAFGVFLWAGYIHVGKPHIVQFLTGQYGIRRWDQGDWRFLTYDVNLNHYQWRSDVYRTDWIRVDSKEKAVTALIAYATHCRFHTDIGRKVKSSND
jgi:hypothetical protein